MEGGKQVRKDNEERDENDFECCSCNGLSGLERQHNNIITNCRSAITKGMELGLPD